ncbi:MAG: amino acid adenylation domain-containing protein, partial [Bacillota bacterium]
MIDKNDIKDIYSLSPMQEGMLFHYIKDRDSDAYFIQLCITLEGELNVDLLENSFNKTIEKYDILRAVFVYEKMRKPLQGVLKKREIQICYEDISSNCEEIKDTFIMNFKTQDRKRGFDISKDVLIRVSVIKLSQQLYKIICSVHHIIIDGWSLGIVIKEVLDTYADFINGRTTANQPAKPYSKYIKWLQAKDKQKAVQYWNNYIGDYNQSLIIPGLKKIVSNKYEKEDFVLKLDRGITEELKRIARDNNVTINTIIQTIWGILLCIYNNTDCALFGSVVSGRTAEIPDIEAMVGLFINSIPVKIEYGREDTFIDLIEVSQQRAVMSEKYSYSPLYEIQSGSMLRQGLINHIIAFENYPIQKEISDFCAKDELGFTIKDIDAFEQTNYDFGMVVLPVEELTVKLSYNSNVYSAEDIRRIGVHIRTIIEQIIIEPSIKIKDINVLSKEEESKLLFEFNNNRSEYPRDKTLHELFEEQVNSNLHNTAVVYEGVKITYKELNEKANQLARVLKRRGVQHGTIVAIMMDNSINVVAAILSVLKSAGIYLPIDPEYPEERVRFILEDSGAAMLLVSKEINKSINFGGEKLIVDLYGEYGEETSDMLSSNTSTSPAYIIYTSGSTGNPKGVIVEHRSLINYITWRIKEYKFTPNDRTLQLISSAFDGFGSNMYCSLLSGGTLVMVNNKSRKNYEEIRHLIKAFNITNMSVVPSMYKALLSRAEDKDLDSLRFIVLAGEKTGEDLLRESYERFPNITLINEYGPTENTIAATAFVGMDFRTGSIIGKPIANNRIYIMDRRNKLQPIGIPGELCIAGESLARGYHNRIDLTKEKFIENPIELGERMYCTGDMARWLSDGNIEFLGRLDYQIKIRGFRVEPGEIESRLLEHEDILEAVVMPIENEGGDKHLFAYIKPKKGFSTEELRKYLLTDLPDYMIPSNFIMLDSMPLTPNGKIDRKTLLQLKENISGGQEYKAPRNETEKKLAAIWKEVLSLEREPGIIHDFFELGGHSLKAAVLTARIHKEFEVELPLSVLFETPTIKVISEYIQKAIKTVHFSIEPVEKREYYPLSSAQKRVYLLTCMGEVNTAYNMPSVIILEGDLDRQRFENTFRKLIEHHESLRTCIYVVDEQPVQKICEEVDFRIEYYHAKEFELCDIMEAFIRPFDLSKAPLLRVGLVEFEDKRYAMLTDMHHIISDGVSAAVMTGDFSKIYKGEVLPELRIQYKDYAVWQNEIQGSEGLKKQEEYWIRKFNGEVPVLDMPIDYPRPPMKSFEGNCIKFSLGKEATERLKVLATENEATLYMLLLAAYNTLLYRYTGQEDIVVGTPIANRTHSDLQEVVGMFVNTLAIRSFPKGSKTFKDFLIEIKKDVLNAFENQDYQFEQLLDKLILNRDASRNPLFDTVFAHQNIEYKPVEVESLNITNYDITNNMSKFDISLTSEDTEEGLLFNMEYCTGIFKKETIERFVSYFVNILVEIVENPDIQLGKIDMLSQEEKNVILYDFNSTYTEYPKDKTIKELFEKQVEETPDNIAVIFEDSSITYKELNRRANQLARIFREKGIVCDSIVGIMAERSLELVTGIMAIIKAGGAYMPIDPEYPKERIRYMLEDSGVEVLLVQHHLASNVKDMVTHVIELERGLCTDIEDLNPQILMDSSNLAYVIYTSGSTGKPKGVMIEHKSLINFLFCIYNKFHRKVCTKDRGLSLTNICFDVSACEIFLPLIFGAGIVLADNSKGIDVSYLSNTIVDKNITFAYIPPTILKDVSEQLYSLMRDRRMSNLHLDKILIGVEPIKDYVLEDYFRLNSSMQIINGYGPTEDTICASFYVYRPGSAAGRNVPIGKPLDNTRIFIIDSFNNLVPVGVPGELCISGDGLARGYLNREQLTAEKFTCNPFEPGEIMYRTGDLARWMPDGNLEFLGRVDHQVKIRGFRIEPGEIENQLLRHKDIKEAVVLAKEKEGYRFLCAYYVSLKELTVQELRECLSKELPDYMIPSYFVKLDKMPVTPNGKIDRKVLPEPDGDINTGTEYEAPGNYIEEVLAGVWQEVLGVKRVGINDNFFSLGGDSIKVLQIQSRIQKYNLRFETKDLFLNATIKDLAGCVKVTAYKAYQGIIESDVKLTPIQKWFFRRNFTDMHHWNQAVMLFKENGFREDLVESVFNNIAKHHDALRMTYISGEEGLRQVNRGLKGKLLDLSICDLREVGEYKDKILEQANIIQRSIDLSNGPLTKLGLFKTREGDYLLIAVHHLIIDGISWRIILEDFETIYRQIEQGREASLPAKTSSYKEWADKLDEYSRDISFEEIQYWKGIEAAEYTPLPKDKVSDEKRLKDGISLSIELPREQTDKLLKEVNVAYNTEINDILLAALGGAIKEWAGHEKVLINLEGHGREEIGEGVDITRTVGWFTSLYPIVIDVADSQDIAR